MNLCGICNHPIEGPHVGHPETGDECHPTCLAKLVLEHAVIALIAATVLVLTPPIIVWAG